MKKTIVTVFLVIGVLLICAMAWDMIFGNGALLSSIWNAVTKPINNAFGKILGNSNVIPTWGTVTTDKTGVTGTW